MKSLLDLFPIVVFVAVYFISGEEKPIYPAVQALMIASVIQVIGYRIIAGKFEKLHLWMLVITIAFGTLTLVFRNPAFIQWKASIALWFFSAVFLYRQYISKKPVIKELLESSFEQALDVPEPVWRNINSVWPIGFFVFGFINLYVAFNFSEAFWVNFKLFGLMGLTLVLIFYSTFKLMPYFPEDDSAKNQTEQKPETDTQEKD